MTKRKVLGIDLGTTYSCVAYVNQYGSAEVILNQNDERTTPSVVWFDGDTAVVGREAKEMASIHPESVCSFIKRQMGSDEYTFDVAGIQYSPEHISSLILRKLVQDAWKRLGEEIWDVVITCPAYFFVKERDATKLAGEQAGLNVLQIVNEPTAAAVSYGVQPGEGNRGSIILVYDLGGGTFDVTIMKVGEAGLDVICTDGDHQLGGKNWDDTLALHLAQRFTEETGIPVDPAEDMEFYYDLMHQAEEAKKHLSERQSVTVRLSHKGEQVRCEITREDFEEMTRDLLEKTVNLTLACLDIARDQGVEYLDQIILVGGSSKMPQVTSRLQKEFGAEPTLFDPDEAIAKGAAIIGNNIVLREDVAEQLTGDRSRSLVLDDVSDTQKAAAIEKVAQQTGFSNAIISSALRPIRNVSSKTFGAISTSDDLSRTVFNIIYRNTPLPCEETQSFMTLCANQSTVLVELMENLSDRSATYDDDLNEFMTVTDSDRYGELFWRFNTSEDESQKLWQGELPIQPGLPAGAPIELTYRLDESGLLTVIARDPASGNQIVETIQTGGEHRDAGFHQTTEKCRSLVVD